MSFEIPTYLLPYKNDGQITHGTLRYVVDKEEEGGSEGLFEVPYYRERNLDGPRWVVEGKPYVTQLAKRLFPGCSGKGRGRVSFPVNKRINADLAWLLLRYPLIIEDPEKWESERLKTIKHLRHLDTIKRVPQKKEPLNFKGKLKEFQKEGLAYLMATRKCLLADEMGLGKTPMALSFLSTSKDLPAIIVVPSHIVHQWAGEIDKFIGINKLSHGGKKKSANQRLMKYFGGSKETRTANGGVDVHIIQGLTPYALPDADVYLIHYLLLRGWKEELPNYNFKTVIYDEIQELRHTGSQKYSSASVLSDPADNVIGLSGTPIYNRGAEIWNILNIIEHQCLGDYASFTREWCAGYYNDIVDDPVTLGEYLRNEGLFIRRRKDDVLSELPPKRRVVQEIDVDKGLFNELIVKAVETASKITKVKKDPFLKGRLTREAIDETRQATGIAKAKYVANFVKVLLEAGERILLVGYHHKVIDIYLNELRDYNPAVVTGRQNQKEKDIAVERFQKYKWANLMIISLRVTTGLNLQKANCVVFGELDWSPAVHSQAEDRIHRIDQKDSVLAYYLVCHTGTDDAMQDTLGLKKSQFVGIMGDKIEDSKDVALGVKAAKEQMQRVIKTLQEKGEKR